MGIFQRPLEQSTAEDDIRRFLHDLPLGDNLACRRNTSLVFPNSLTSEPKPARIGCTD